MSTIKTPYYYYINSNNRISGSHSNFSYYLPGIPEDADRVAVTTISIPVSFYLVRDFYEDFELTENGVTTSISLEPGNYTLRQLYTVLTQLLTNNSPNNWIYTVTYPTNFSNGKLDFTVTTLASTDIISIDAGESLYELLGFNKSSVNTFTYSGASNIYTLESINCINLLPETTLYLRSDICRNNSSDSNILQEVYSTVAIPFSYITYTNASPEQTSKIFNSGNNNNIFNFYISDENGLIVDTNNVNVNFCLLIYKRDDINKDIRDFIDISRDFMNYYINSQKQL